MLDRGKGGVEVHVGDKPPWIRPGRTPQESLSYAGGKPPARLNVRMGNVRAMVRNGVIDFRSGKRQGRIVRGKPPKVIRGKR